MAKEKKDAALKAPEQIASNVRSYFTKEINERIANMSVKEMEAVMKEMINTNHWIALLKYTSMRTPLLDAQLRTLNPSKDPHVISWSQGAMAGICDIETYIIDLNAPKPKEEEPEENQPAGGRPEGVVG